MRAAIYLRISQDKTGEQAGVDRQREDCEQLVAAQGWEVQEVYIDNDISASSGKARPAYKSLLQNISDGHVDAIVAWHPDRLYRKLKDLEALVDAIEKRNVVMRTVRAGEIDLSTPTGRMLARIVSATAQAEGEIKSDRWMRSVRQRREAGAMPGSGPRMKGWTRKGEIISDEADEIRWLARQILDGTSLNRLATNARDKGIRSTLGRIMPAQSIKRLLLNPRLAGYSVLSHLEQSGVNADGKPTYRRVAEIMGTGEWTPILDTDTWENVRSLLTSRGHRPAPPRIATLAGLIWCDCGARMVTGSRVTKAKTMSRTYRCDHNANSGGCRKVAIAAHIVEEVVEGYAEERLHDPKIRARIEALRSVPRGELAEMTALQARLVELEQQLDEPGVPVAALVRAMDRTKARLKELGEIVAHAPTVPLPTQNQPWPEDVGTRAALVALVVAKVTIRPSTRPGIIDLERIEIEPR